MRLTLFLRSSSGQCFTRAPGTPKSIVMTPSSENQHHTAGERRRASIDRAISTVALIAFSLYLLWRGAVTLEGTNVALALVLLVTEVAVLLEIGGEVFRRWPGSGRKARPRVVAASDRLSGEDITVVVTSGGASPDLVRVSLLGALALRPSSVVLVSVRPDEDLVRMAHRLGVHLWTIDRAGPGSGQGGPADEARLINSNLSRFVTPWVLVLEPGDVPDPDLVRRLPPIEPSAGVLTLDQREVDSNSFEYAARLRWIRMVDLRVDRPNLTRRGLVEWTPSPSLVRVRALQEVGGLVEADQYHRLTGALLNRHGWAVGSSGIDLAVGPGSADLEALLSRERRVLATPDTTRYFTAPGPHRLKRLLGRLTSLTPVLSAARRSVQLVVVAVVLSTNLVPAAMSWRAALGVVVPVYLVRAVARSRLARDLVPWRSRYLHELRTIGAHLGFLVELIAGRTHRSARAGIDRPAPDPGGKSAVARTLSVQLALVLLLDAAVILAAAGTFLDQPFGAKGLLFLVFSAIGLFHIVGLTQVLTNAVSRRQVRQHSRIPVNLDLLINGVRARAFDLTSHGIGVVSIIEMKPGSHVLLQVHVDDEGPLELLGEITHAHRLERTRHELYAAGVRWISADDWAVDRLWNYCAIDWPFAELRRIESTEPSQVDGAGAL